MKSISEEKEQEEEEEKRKKERRRSLTRVGHKLDVAESFLTARNFSQTGRRRGEGISRTNFLGLFSLNLE